MFILWKITQRRGYDGQELIGLFNKRDAAEEYVNQHPASGESYHDITEAEVLDQENLR